MKFASLARLCTENSVLFLTCEQDDESIQDSEDTDNSKSHLKITEFLSMVGYVFHSVILYGEVKIFEWTELTSVTAANRVT